MFFQDLEKKQFDTKPQLDTKLRKETITVTGIKILWKNHSSILMLFFSFGGLLGLVDVNWLPKCYLYGFMVL